MRDEVRGGADKTQAERVSFDAIKLRLLEAFSTPEDLYERVSANDIRNRVASGAKR